MEDNDNLFGSDNDEEDEKKERGQQEDSDDDDMKIEGAKGKKTEDSALFGSDDDEEEDGDVEKEEKEDRDEDDEDGEDGKSRFTSKQQDLDDLFGADNSDPLFTAPAIIKKPISVSKLCIPIRNVLPDSSACMAIKMPNFVKIAPTCFDPQTLDVEEEGRLMGGATSVIRWRYKVDINGDAEIGADGEPVRESNARYEQY